MDDTLTTAQAAKVIGCTDGRVRQLVRKNAIKFVRKSPRVVLIPRKEAERLRDNPSRVGRPRKSA